MTTPGSSSPDPKDLDALRSRLRALGYLDAPVDRFVLGGTRARSMALVWPASLRIGALAGVLLGPAAVVGLVTRAPDLVVRPLDAVVLAVYLMVPLAIAATLLAGVTVFAGLWLARRSAGQPGLAARARRAATAAGLTAAAACLLYLTLWWQAAVPPGDVPAQVIALVVAAAIALVLGHGVTVVVLASLVRAGYTDLPSGTPLSSWRVLAPTGVVAVAAAWLVLRAWTPTAAVAPDVPPLTVVPTGARVTVVAIDGADPSLLSQMIHAGALPTMTRWSAGSQAPITLDADRDPARVWTTFATGQPPATHGIRSLEGRQLAGVEGRVDATQPSLLTTATDLLRLSRPTIASGDQRQVPAFWEIAHRAGLRTASLHWWTTWPASDADGIVLSDRAILRLEQGGPLAGEIAPETLYPTLQASTPSRQARVQHWLAPLDAEFTGEVAAIVHRSATLDATILALADDPALGALDLLTMYLPGLDILQHALFPTSGQVLAPAAATDRVRAVEAYYRFLDRALGEITETLDSSPAPARVTLLVTHPGRISGGAEGRLFVSGAGAGTGSHAAMRPEALTPTILRALGVPVARDLSDTPGDALFEPAFVTAHPVRWTTTYGARQTTTAVPEGRPLDREMIERMRSLGYVR